MKPRSLLIIGVILLLGFGGLLGLSVYSNLRLQAFHKTLSKANNLLLAWNKCEIMTKELFMTYNLLQTKKEWLSVIHQFDADFREFLHSPVTLDLIDNDADFELDVKMIKMYWSVIKRRLLSVDAPLRLWIDLGKSRRNTGNLLVDFGMNLTTRQYSDSLLEVISILRGRPVFSRISFTKSLTDVSRYASANIQVQARWLHVSTLLLSALILGTTGILIMYRMMEMARSRTASQQHAKALQTEIEERRHAEERLHSERDKLRSVLNAMGDGMYIVNRDFIIEYHNDIPGRDYGGVVGEKCFDRYVKSNTPCAFCLSQDTIRSGEIRHVEALLDDGTNYELIFSPFADVDGEIKAIVLWRDITEKKRIEAEAVRAGHLASIGELAAGVAHEINNPINGIINYAERLEGQCHNPALDPDIPARIIKEGDRIAQIIRNLLSFAENRKEDLVSASVHDILSNSLELVEKQIIKDGIDLKIRLASDLPEIKARSHEIQQVFLNILSNARHALKLKYPGLHKNKILDIHGQTLEMDGQRYVRTIFHDRGTGIAEDIMDRLCDPFFSTKPTGEGTGLGLSISHGLIRGHGGRLAFESVQNEYAKVIVDLPANDNVK